MIQHLKALREFVEIPIFFVFFGMAIVDPVHTVYVTYQTCTVILGYNETMCELLATDSSDDFIQELRNIVQPRAAIVLMTTGLIGAIIPVGLCLFLGPWSDRNGRRVLMLVNLGGFSIAAGIKLILVLMGSISPWFFLLDAIPVIFTGGFPTYIMAVLCYVTDKTTAANRGIRMATFECAIASGMLVGTVSSSFILNSTNYATIYAIAFIAVVVSFMFTYAFIPETVIRTTDLDGGGKLFTLVHVKEMIRTTVRKREVWNRAILFLIIGAMLLFVLTSNTGSVTYLYISNKFHWTLQQYTLYQSVLGVLWIVGTVVGVYLLHRLFHVQETIVLVVGYICMFLSSTIQGLAQSDWQLYSAGGIRTFGGVVGPMMRSLMSKIVPAEEIGKVFALTVVVEFIMGIGGGPLYAIIYTNTVDFAPQAFNFVSSAFYCAQLVICLVIMMLQRLKAPQDLSYNTMDNESSA